MPNLGPTELLLILFVLLPGVTVVALVLSKRKKPPHQGYPPPPNGPYPSQGPPPGQQQPPGQQPPPPNQ